MPAPKYADRTKVPISQSQEEIKKTLRKYGATGFGYVEEATYVALLFILAGGTPNERRVRFTMPLPSAAELTVTKQEQETQRRWRALAAGIKAKLILVEEGIESIEEAFYANIVLPDNTTIFESTRQRVAFAYERGLMPATLLPALPAKEDSP